MNLTIIGASKGTGKEVLHRALSSGIHVTALVRDSKNIELKNNNLTVVEGDFKDYDSVYNSIKEADTIVLTVGTFPTRKPVDLFSEGTKNVIKAITELKTNPLIIAITGFGAGDSKGQIDFDDINVSLFKTIYEDKDRQESFLKTNYENWIIVRPGVLTNDPKTGEIRAYTDLKGIKAGKISRADVASFILEQAKSPTFLKQTPMVMN